MKELINLRYDMYPAPMEHPQVVMKKLGIKYQIAVPQSIADQWWFLNCENVPDNLPKYLEPLNNYETGQQIKFDEMIGYGLNESDVVRLNKFKEDYYGNTGNKNI